MFTFYIQIFKSIALSSNCAAQFVLDVVGNTHYANMPMEYTAMFHGCKNVTFQIKCFNIFPLFAQNIN